MTIYRRPDPIPRPRPGPAIAAVMKSEGQDRRAEVSRLLFQSVLRGVFREGSVLPNERDLAAQLAVSRTVLREAVNGLSAKGLLEARRKRGTVILDRSRWNMLDDDLIRWAAELEPASIEAELSVALEEVSRILASLIRRQAAGRGGVVDRVYEVDDVAEDFDEDSITGLAADTGNRFLGTIASALVRNLAKVREASEPGGSTAVHREERVAGAGSLAARATVDA